MGSSTDRQARGTASVLHHHLAEVFAGTQIAVGVERFVKRKAPVDYRPDRSSEELLEHLSRADEDAVEPHVIENHRYQIEICRGAGQEADDADFSAQAD